MLKDKLKGTGVALVTPFKQNLQPDHKAFERILNHVIDGGVNYIVLFGTTGESATVTDQEQQELLVKAKEIVDQRVPLVLGLGGNCTDHIVHAFQKWDLSGIEAILSVSPYYNKPSQEGLYRHYMTIAENSSRPVILYNVPGRTNCNITAETTLRLARDAENIIAVKEASGDLLQCMEILRNKPRDFLVLSGDDPLTYPLLSLGMDGVISVIANAYPKKFTNMVSLALQKEWDEALKLHYELIPAMHLVLQEGNPSGVKALLSSKGLCENTVRLPLTSVSDELLEKMNKLE